ncbi:MAG: hypothetical protein ABIP71_14405, partial [Verrucomicrobiota bacterium]
FETPVGLRAALLVGAIGMIALAAMRWSSRWIILRRDWRALSVIVQRKFRKLGDHLLGIVELSNESKHDVNYSPELYRAAINQVADETAPFDFREAVETRLTKRLIVATIGLALLVLIPSLLIPALGKNVFHRWIAPLAAVPRYTLVKLDLPEQIVVPHGENFALNGTVEFRSFWKPARATAQFEKQTRVAARVSGNKMRFEIPAQIQNGKLRIKLGDARREVAIVPTYRPALKQMSASIQLPEYLRTPATNQVINNGVLNVLEGSTFSLRGKISRELASAESRFGGSVETLQTNKDEFSSGVFSNTTVLQYAFNWRDNLGLSNAVPWKLSVRPQKDLPPTPAMPDMPSDMAMLDTDVLEIKTQAKDDYGVLDLGLNWDFESDSVRPQGSSVTEIKIQPSSPHLKNLEKTFRWSPAIFRIPEDSSVEIQAVARDYLPARERAESSVHRIHILGKEKHAELIRQKLESLLARVEEVTRLEEKVMANTTDVSENDKLTDQQKSERIGKANEDQERNAKNLEQLANEGMKTLQEALKNPVFTEQTLQEWAKNLQQMEKLSQKEMKSAGESLKSAQKNPKPEAREKDLAEALKKEKEVLDSLEKMQGKVNKDLDNLQALTLSERLRKVGSMETEIGAELQKIIPDTIGMLPKELPEKFKKVGATLANRQQSAHTESQQLQNEINRFFERTQKENYGEVSKEIAEARTIEEMELMGGMIRDNVAMQAMKNLGEWSERFEKWADKLEPEKVDSDSGESSGGESPEDMTKALLALLRLREKEITVREQTRLLDENKGDDTNYKERTGALSETQKKLAEDMTNLANENTIPTLVGTYHQADEAMEDVHSFLQKPQTDAPTLEAQVKAVDLITDLVNLINEQAKRLNPKPQEGESQSTAEQMAFLMQMMSQGNKPGKPMSMNPNGAPNQRGGSTDKIGAESSGDVSGKSGDNRRVEKASGAAGISLPAEFRETLENYFKALEGETN